MYKDENVVLRGERFDDGSYDYESPVRYWMPFNAAAGVEYCYAGIVATRAGYHFGSKDKGIPSYVSVGLGAGFGRLVGRLLQELQHISKKYCRLSGSKITIIKIFC